MSNDKKKEEGIEIIYDINQEQALRPLDDLPFLLGHF